MTAMTTRGVVDPEVFRQLMRHHAKGVAIITTGVDIPIGFCATSLTSVSLDPPLVSFTVGLRAASRAPVESARQVIAHLLNEGQESLARRFADPNTVKFGAGTQWHRGELGLPVLDDVLAWLALAPLSYLLTGDHTLVIGQVIAVRNVTNGRPLIHHDGRFTRLAPSARTN